MKQNGFTLIEILISFAIVGIIASIALPQYFKYMAQSKIAAGFQEIAGAKAGFEIQLNDGNPAVTLDQIKIQALTPNCNISIETNDTLKCVLRQAPSVINGATIQWRHISITGNWECESNVDALYRLASCQGVIP